MISFLPGFQYVEGAQPLRSQSCYKGTDVTKILLSKINKKCWNGILSEAQQIVFLKRGGGGGVCETGCGLHDLANGFNNIET